MTIQYPGPLDKNRQVFIAMDNTDARKNDTIYRTIINKLKANGINNIKEFRVGPNYLYSAMSTMAKQKKTNAIVVYVANGLDPTNIKELGMPGPNGEWGALWGNDNTGRKARSLGNDAVIALFYDSCDPSRPSGTCYNKLRTRSPRTDVEDGGRWPPNEKPIDYMRRNKIYIVNRSSNQHNKNGSSFNYDAVKDYTGEKIGQAIADLFVYGQPDENGGTPHATPGTNPVTPTPTNTTGEIVTGDGTKTVATKIITKSYTFPYYERVYKLKTDRNGAFSLLHKLPYQGEYKLVMKFGGDKTHQSSTKSITVKNHSRKASIFKETLLHTETTIKYTDNSVETQSTGALPDNKNIKKVQTTETYENGVLKDKSTKTIYMNDVLKEADKTITPEIPTVTGDNNTIVQEVTSKNAANPFNQRIPLKTDGTPNLTMMTVNGKSFVNVDWSKSYTLTKAQYLAVMQRDSRTLQINKYKPSKYTAFESTTDNNYTVVPRETWNMLEESIYHYRIFNGSGKNSPAFPDTVVFNFQARTTTCNGVTTVWKGNAEPHNYGWKGCNCWWVGDGQYWGRSCGPTSSSVCTQVLHNQYTEREMEAIIHSNWSDGSGPDTLRRALIKKGFGAETFYGKNTALEWVSAGKPVIWHISDHYICLAARTANGNVCICNSAGEGHHTKYNQNGDSYTGWHSSNNVHGQAGANVKVWLNYKLSTTEVTQLTNFLESMGGSWTLPNTNEHIRKSSYGT